MTGAPAPTSAPEHIDRHSASEAETRALGRRLAGAMCGGELLGLRGELGCGKTVLVRGLAEGLGIAPGKVRSPTFTLINEYHGGRLPLYHIDLYRVRPSEVDRLALREYLYGDGVCVVEWFDLLGEDAQHLDIAFTILGPSARRIVVSAHGARYVPMITQLQDG